MVDQQIFMISYCMMHGTSYTLTGEGIRRTWKTQTWLKMMWENLGRLEIELIWSALTYLLNQREGGMCILLEFTGLYDMYKRKMSALNHILLSMEIYVISDLATGNGLSIRKDMVAA